MPTVDEFKTYGMSDLNELTEEAISQLGDNFKILVLTKDSTINSLSVDVTAIPKRQIIQQETDMILPAPIKAFTLTATAQNSSVLKILSSVDSGLTWQAFNVDQWVPVDINNLDDAATNGMTAATLNGITEETWKAYIGDNLKIRFAYYLDLNLVTDTLQLDKLAYETVPVVNKSPKLNSIKITYDDLTIEGRLKDLERINAINIAKLNFKSNALLQSEKYEMHDMIIDTCDTEEMITLSTSDDTFKLINTNFLNIVPLGAGYLSELPLSDYSNIKNIDANPSNGTSAKFLIQDGNDIKRYDPAEEDVAFNKTATASSSYDDPQKALDDNPNSMWNAGIGGNANTWWRVDLGKVYTIGKIVCQGVRVTSVRLLGSNDDVNYEVIQTITGLNGTTTPVSLDVPATYRYLKVDKINTPEWTNIQTFKAFTVGEGKLETIGTAPVTEEMFTSYGMADTVQISKEILSKMNTSAKIISFANSNEAISAIVKVGTLYNLLDKSYHGTGIIETEIEELPASRKFILINAEHEGCTFKYSLNNGQTWTDINSGDVKDISKENGVQLKIQINLPTDNATLTAISYAWA